MKQYTEQYKGIKIVIFDFINSSKQHIRHEFLLKEKKIRKMLAKGFCEPVQIVTLLDEKHHNKETYLKEMQEVADAINQEIGCFLNFLSAASTAYDNAH